VQPGHYAFEAVEWAAEVGVTAGYGDGSFKPERSLIKRHAVVFMERYYDDVLEADESEDFTRGDMMVLLKAINDGAFNARPSLPPLPEKTHGSDLSSYDFWGYTWLRDNMPGREQLIRELAWVQDGINISELEAVEGLIYFAILHSDVFIDLLEEPWVLAGQSKPAIVSLKRLANSDPQGFDQIMSHPTITDGITGDETKLVAVLYSMYKRGPNLAELLLDQQEPNLEERTIVTRAGEELPIIIVRTEPGSKRTMDIIEEVIKSHSDFMSMPWPSENVIQLFAGDVEGANGLHFGSNIRSDADIDAGTRTLARDFDHLAHENGHYFWNRSEAWVSEGGADVLAAVAKRARFGWPVEPEDEPCPFANSLSDLEASRCPYQLGQRLFLDLYHQLDEITFRTAFRRLFVLSRYDDKSDECEGTRLGICHVEAAFKFDAAPEVETIVDEVAARWYYGTLPHSTRKQSLRDDAPADPYISEMDVRIDQAWISAAPGGTPVTQVRWVDRSEVWADLWLNLTFSVGQQAKAGDLALETVLFYQGDGFTFARQHDNLRLTSDENKAESSFRLGDPSSVWGKPGRYLAYVYHQRQKVAELSYEITT